LKNKPTEEGVPINKGEEAHEKGKTKKALPLKGFFQERLEGSDLESCFSRRE